MRLPALTAKHRQFEDARALHERLFAAFKMGERVQLPTSPDRIVDDQAKVSWNLHRFWRVRGFVLKTKSSPDRRTLLVWLEQPEALPVRPRKARGESMQVAKTVGPAVPVMCEDCGQKAERRRSWDAFEFAPCKACGGEVQPRKREWDTRADAKAKRELAEQEGAA